MHRYLTILLALTFLLFATAAIAQTSSSSGQYSNPSSASPQASSSQAGASSQQTIEGCLVKESSDFFLVPKSGNPIKLEATAREDLAEHEGHKVKVTGNETSMGAAASGSSAGTAGTAAGTPSSAERNPSSAASGAVGSSAGQSGTAGSAGAASETSGELHKLADREMTVSKLQHIAASCPADWNPSVPIPRSR